jgi:hypothetical protein
MPVHWESWVNVVLGVTLLPIGVVLLVHGVTHRAIVAGICGVVLCLIALPLLVQSGTEVLRRPRLYERVLVVTTGWHRSVRIPLHEISGVGMLYEIGGPRSGWTMRIWTVNGDSYGVPSVRSYRRGLKLASAPPPPRGTPRWHRPRLDWVAQAGTPAGRATGRVFRQVLQVQGPAGPLVLEAEQTTAPSYGTYLAYWSPDGRIGWLRDVVRE